MRPLRSPASTNPSDGSNSTCTTTLAAPLARRLRTVKRICMGTCNFACVGTSSSAMSSSAGGFKGGRGNRLVVGEPYPPFGSILEDA